MRAIGDALGVGREVVIVSGNHDHAVAAGWLDWRGRRDEPEPLGLDERVPPQHASWIAKRLAGWLSPASVQLAYPGLWLRDDVYATHGHYLDVHCAIPTLEVLSARAIARLVGAVPEREATPDDYEAVLAPLYAFIQASAQRSANGRRAAGGGTAVSVWHALEGPGRPRAPRRVAARTGFRGAVAAVQPAGLGPVQAEIGGVALRRATLAGLAEIRAPPRADARAPDLRPHPPHRHARRRRPCRVDDARRHGAAQRRTVGLRDALHGRRRRAEWEPLLARRRDRARRRRPAAPGAAARRRTRTFSGRQARSEPEGGDSSWCRQATLRRITPRRSGQPGRELHGVADRRRRRPRARARPPCGARARRARSSRSARRRSRGRSRERPGSAAPAGAVRSSTAQTPPAS